MLKGEASKMVWEDLLMHLKREYYSEQDLLKINNEFKNLKKGRLSVSEYVSAFTEKKKIVP